MSDNKLPTDAQLAQVHRELEALLHESHKRACYEATLRGYGLRALHQHGSLGDLKPFMFPTLKGWRAGAGDVG